MNSRATSAIRLLAGDKEPVRLASTANLALAGLLTVDGVATVAGNRILVKDQTDATENGIYTASEGAWYRATDANSDRVLIAGMKVHVQEGTVNAGALWSLATNRPDLGEDAINWVFYLDTELAAAVAALGGAVDNVLDRFATKALFVAATIAASLKAASWLGYTTAGDGGEQLLRRAALEPDHDGKARSADRFLPDGSTHAGNGGWWEYVGPVYNIMAFGAVPRTSDADITTDSTAAIQAAMDMAIGLTSQTSTPVEVLVPASEFGWNITQLVFNAENLHLVGIGGPNGNDCALHYIGTAASATAMIYADFIVHRGGELYRGCAIRNLRIDGEGKALHCIKVNGWTRYCFVEHVTCLAAVNPIHCTNGFYSRWVDIEVFSPPKILPVGMNPVAYAANLYGAFFDICHIMRLESLKVHDVGAVLTYIYTAGLRINASEAVHVANMTLETSREASDRFWTSGVHVGSGSTVTFDSTYFENCDFHDQMFNLSEDNIMVTFQGVNYWNDLKFPVGIRAGALTPIAFSGSTFCEALNVADRFFKEASGSGKLRGVTLNGNMTMFSGPATGGAYYNAAAVASSIGVTTDSITSMVADGTATGTGTIISGYVPSIVSNYITVTPGRAIINTWPVSNMRHGGLRQRLYPDLSYNGSWHVKVNSLGCPYIEKQAAVQPGSAYAKAIATFNTTGGTNNPSSLVLL